MSDQGFFSRWTQRKQQVQEEAEALKKAAPLSPPTEDKPRTAQESPAAHQADIETNTGDTNDSTGPAQPPLTENTSNAQTDAERDTPLSDDDMPDLNSIDGNTNVSAFFSEGVSETLRKQALKAMFLKPEFNIRDGMDDYDLNYADAKELSSDVAAGLRNWFKNKDPLDLEGKKEAGAEATVAAVENTDSATDDANGSPENQLTDPQSTGSQVTASETSQRPGEDRTDKPHPEPDQNRTDLASGKRISTDSAPD